MSSTPTAAAVDIVHSHCLSAILQIAQTAMIGAMISICSPSTISICTWVTSLVERVIRLAVEK